MMKAGAQNNFDKKSQHTIREFLGLKGNVVPLLVITLLIYTAEKLWERFLPKYFEGIGATFLIIGGLGFLQNMLGALWSLAGGYIAGRFGTRKSFLIFNLFAITGYVTAIVFTSWIAIFIGMIFFSAWSNVSLPASMSLIVDSLGKKKTVMGISMHSFIRRIPMALGPVIGGVLISHYGIVAGVKLSFAVSIILCLAGMIIQTGLKDIKNQNISILNPVSLWKKMDSRLKNLLLSDILIRFCEQIPYVFVVIWCIDNLKVSPTFFGVLTAVEMTVAALIYIPVASFSDRMEKKPFIVITFLFFSAFPMFLFLSKNWLSLVLAFVIRGLKEFGEPTRKALITELCPAGLKSEAFGLYYFVRDSTVAFAAFLGGWLWIKGPVINFTTATVFGILGSVFFIIFGRETSHPGKK